MPASILSVNSTVKCSVLVPLESIEPAFAKGSRVEEEISFLAMEE
jgi:hypothetical protein